MINKRINIQIRSIFDLYLFIKQQSKKSSVIYLPIYFFVGFGFVNKIYINQSFIFSIDNRSH